MTSLWRAGLVIIAVTSGAALAQGCGSSSRAAGSVGGACFEGGVCAGTLVCLSEICVAPPEAGSGGGAGSGGAAGGAGVPSAGGAGGGSAVGCTAATTMLAPAGGLIADFTGADGGLEIGGMLFPYSSSGAALPTESTAGGALHITENGLATSAAQYVGVVLVFADCIDAKAFTGVQFSIAGSFSGCTMQYGTTDSGHQDPANGPVYAAGPTGAYPPQSTLTAAQVTSAPQTLMMPFTGSTMFGDPQTPLDTTKLILLLWQFTIPAGAPATTDGGTPACIADITIDNVAFY